jgi:hypothetical protein
MEVGCKQLALVEGFECVAALAVSLPVSRCRGFFAGHNTRWDLVGGDLTRWRGNWMKTYGGDRVEENKNNSLLRNPIDESPQLSLITAQTPNNISACLSIDKHATANAFDA